MLYLCLQECTWFYAYEDPAVSRNWKIYSRSIQQTIRQYSRNDPPLHSEQTANPWGRTHVSLTSCHWAVTLATAILLHYFKAVSAQWCNDLWWQIFNAAFTIYNLLVWSTDSRFHSKPSGTEYHASSLLMMHFYTIRNINASRLWNIK